MKKATLVLMSLILLVAFTGICEARHTFNNPNPLIGIYIPSSLNQPYGFPVKMWNDTYVVKVEEEYTGWHTTCIGASWVDKSPKPVADTTPKVRVVIKERVVEKTIPVIVTKIVIVLPPVYFGINNKAVTCVKGTIPTLDQIIKVLQDNPKIKVEIRGYTDDTGNEALNQKLSENRALSVQKYLIDKGIDKDRLSVKGFGSSNPVSDNKTAAGRSQNRRVEFFVIE